MSRKAPAKAPTPSYSAKIPTEERDRSKPLYSRTPFGWRQAKKDLETTEALLEALAAFGDSGDTPVSVISSRQASRWQEEMAMMTFEDYDQARDFVLHFIDLVDCKEVNLTPTYPKEQVGSDPELRESAGCLRRPIAFSCNSCRL